MISWSRVSTAAAEDREASWRGRAQPSLVREVATFERGRRGRDRGQSGRVGSPSRRGCARLRLVGVTFGVVGAASSRGCARPALATPQSDVETARSRRGCPRPHLFSGGSGGRDARCRVLGSRASDGWAPPRLLGSRTSEGWVRPRLARRARTLVDAVSKKANSPLAFLDQLTP